MLNNVRVSARRVGIAATRAHVRCLSGEAGKTHFGFKTVDEGDKVKLVGDVFRRVADSYDVMNDLMSASLHRLWKDEFVRMAGPLLSPTRTEQTVLLDVAGGTGDIAFRLVNKMRRSYIRPRVRPRVIVCDINPSMLGVGQERARALGLDLAPAADAAAHTAADTAAAGDAGASAASDADLNSPELVWQQGDAEKLPFPDSSVDLYTIAFGIRNVTHVDAALREAYRVLRPGGRFMCLEFSRVNNPLLRAAYDAYSFNVIPAMGQVVANDRESYQYLVESIRKFPDQETFADMIATAGFSGVSYTDQTFGVCAIHSGFKWRPQAGSSSSSSSSSSGSGSSSRYGMV